MLFKLPLEHHIESVETITPTLGFLFQSLSTGSELSLQHLQAQPRLHDMSHLGRTVGFRCSLLTHSLFSSSQREQEVDT